MTHPQLLALLLLLPAIAALWRARSGRVNLPALLLRLGAVALLVLALTDIRIGQPAPTAGPLVILLDQSDSLDQAGAAELRAIAEQLATEQAGPVRVLAFGAQPLVADTTQLDRSATDIAAALQSAGALLQSGGRVLLLSDGLQTSGDALGIAQQLAQRGLRVDVLPYQPDSAADVRISSFQLPRTLRVGEEYSINLQIESNNTTQIVLRLFEGQQLVAEQQLALQAGANPFSLNRKAQTAGILQLRAEISLADDRFSANNMLGATALVAEPARVLIVEGRSGSSVQLRSALRGAGVESDLIEPRFLSSNLADLSRYDGLLLIDVPASLLSFDQMLAVRELVRSEGKGLLVTGGRSSYGLGGYKGTPLEEVLPVLMDPPPRKERPDVALLLIIDRSASMETASGPGANKFDMAREAAILATESLRPEDRVGIAAFDTIPAWVVNFQPVGEGLSQRQVQDAIAGIGLGGGTDIFSALNFALPALAEQPATVRHAVLLTDGRSFFTDSEPYRRLLEELVNREITLSTIAIGQDSDTVLLTQLAEWGRGRYYFAATPDDIPRLTLLETEIARSDPLVEQPLRAEAADTRGHPLLRDFAPYNIPELEGYVATTLRPEAELVLRSPEEDPLLAAWQYGLGRAVAWTSQVEAPWAADWVYWGDYGRFWGQLVRYTLPEPGSGPLQIRVERHGSNALLVVESSRPGGAPQDLATTTVELTLPDGTQRRFPLRQIAPGRYGQELQLAAGPYAISASQEADGARRSAAAGYTQRYPDEYAISGDGSALLLEIARISGGGVISVGNTGLAENALPVRETIMLWPWFAGAALLLWLIEIAYRRGLLSLSFRR